VVNRDGFIEIMRTMSAVENLILIQQSITRAESDWGREPDSVQLVAVSKTFPADAIAPVIAAGHRVFGENYVQETAEKWPGLRALVDDLTLHMIGPLQSNKAKEAVALFDVIQSLDRESLAKELAKEMNKQGRMPLLFVQVNTGEEAQKGGVMPSALDEFVTRMRQVYGFVIAGLMCIPPADQPPSPHFAFCRKLAERNGIGQLSMGMSADYEQAIRLGATHVRVGSAIFGGRPIK
jgi:PLP dependent protein